MLNLVLVSLLLIAFAKGLERGDRCVNQHGAKATCTDMASCKAAIDAVTIAKGSPIYASGVSCGFDTEPLVCCRTPADFSEVLSNALSVNKGPSTSKGKDSDFTSNFADLNIFSNFTTNEKPVKLIVRFPGQIVSTNGTSQYNNRVEVKLSDRQGEIDLQNSVITVTMAGTDEVLYTSRPLPLAPSKSPASVEPTASQVTPPVTTGSTESFINIFTKPSSVKPDALPLGTNNASAVSFVPSRDSDLFPNIFSGSPSTAPEPSPQSSPQPPPPPPLFVPQVQQSPQKPIVPNKPSEPNVNKLLPDRNVCGMQNEWKRLENVPIASMDEFPWAVLLKYQYGYGIDAGYRCTGALISDRYVVTSAECLLSDPELFYLEEVRLGEWSVSSSQDCSFDKGIKLCTTPVLDVAIEKKTPHPHYDPVTGLNNIGLVRLGRKVDYTEYIRPICLPIVNLGTPRVGTIFTTSGWGASRFGLELDVKSKFIFPVTSSQKCKNYGLRDVSDDQICLDPNCKGFSCMTDAGGPVMALDNIQTPQWYLEGVFPESFNCNRGALPSVYTRATTHVSWILKTIAADEGLSS